MENNTRQNLLMESQEALRRYTEELHDSDEENESTLNLLKEHMKYYRNAQARFQAMENCTTRTMEKIKSAENSQEIDELFSAYEDEMKKVQTIDVAVNDSTYQEFLSLLVHNEGEKADENEDICTVKERINTLDPISKKKLVDPVKNKKCGHVYERSTMLELIRKHPNTRCPMVGCVNKVFVAADHLESDLKLKRYLAVHNESLNDSSSQSVVDISV